MKLTDSETDHLIVGLLGCCTICIVPYVQSQMSNNIFFLFASCDHSAIKNGIQAS